MNLEKNFSVEKLKFKGPLNVAVKKRVEVVDMIPRLKLI